MEINKNIFREYDIRGVYPTDINMDIAYLIGKGYGSYIREKLNIDTCVVGRDIRYSSDELTKHLIKGIINSGTNVINLGICTTPMYYYACQKTKKYIGVMVTASHNPKDDNGFKIAFDRLSNARGKMISDFRDYVINGKFLDGTGKIANYEPLDDYIKLLKNATNMGSKKIKVVFDCANATTGLFIKNIISNFPNIEADYLFTDIAPTFPNHHPDPCVENNTEQLKKRVIELGYDLGVGYDGDGDRLGAVDHLGNFISADKILALFAKDIALNNDNKSVLYDIKCSNVVKDIILKYGGTPISYRAGASYTRFKTVEGGYALGGELAGHFTFNDRFPGFDSGIYSSLRLIEILSKSDKSLYELIKEFPKYYNTPEIRVSVSDESKMQLIETIKEYCINKEYKIDTIDGVKVIFDYGWALIRCSNTGPNITIRYEGNTEDNLNTISNEFDFLINKLTKEL